MNRFLIWYFAARCVALTTPPRSNRLPRDAPYLSRRGVMTKTMEADALGRLFWRVKEKLVRARDRTTRSRLTSRSCGHPAWSQSSRLTCPRTLPSSLGQHWGRHATAGRIGFEARKAGSAV